MPREIQQLVNSPMLWMITLMSIALVLGMAAYFLVKSIKVAKSIGVTKEQISITETAIMADAAAVHITDRENSTAPGSTGHMERLCGRNQM